MDEAAPTLFRVIYDFRRPLWMKFGCVAFVARREDALDACQAAEPDAEITIVSVTPTTERVRAAHEARVEAARVWLANVAAGRPNRSEP